MLSPLNVQGNATVSWQTTRGTNPIGKLGRIFDDYDRWNASLHNPLHNERFQILQQKGHEYWNIKSPAPPRMVKNNSQARSCNELTGPTLRDRLSVSNFQSPKTHCYPLYKMRLPLLPILKSSIQMIREVSPKCVASSTTEALHDDQRDRFLSRNLIVAFHLLGWVMRSRNRKRSRSRGFRFPKLEIHESCRVRFR